MKSTKGQRSQTDGRTDGEMIEEKRKKKKRETDGEEGDTGQRQRVEGVGGTCAAVSLSFNPLRFFLPPFPTFSVLIDKHREGTGPRD